DLAGAGAVDAAGFADGYARALTERVRDAVAVKSVIAYRYGLDIPRIDRRALTCNGRRVPGSRPAVGGSPIRCCCGTSSGPAWTSRSWAGAPPPTGPTDASQPARPPENGAWPASVARRHSPPRHNRWRLPTWRPSPWGSRASSGSRSAGRTPAAYRW